MLLLYDRLLYLHYLFTFFGYTVQLILMELVPCKFNIITPCNITVGLFAYTIIQNLSLLEFTDFQLMHGSDLIKSIV